MKKFVIGLLVAFIAFYCGVFAAKIFRAEQKTIPETVFEKEIVNYSVLKNAPIINTEKVEVAQSIDKQTIYGWYSLKNYGKLSEVDMIKLYRTTSNPDGTETEKIISYSGIYMKFSDDRDEEFAKGIETTIDGNKVKFKTQKLKGIEYRFEGIFFKNKATGEEGEEILRGTLQKYIKGKKVAEVSGDFAYYEPFCLN